jgi:hypothetical protein
MNPVLENITILVGNWGQAAGSLFTALAFWLAYREFKRSEARDTEAEKDELETRQLEIYQRLELESMSVFRYETEYRSMIHWYKTQLAPVDPPPFDAPIEEANLCARKYYEMSCNLFEIAIRLREKNANYVEDDVLGSWVAWFFDVTCEWGFRAVWADLRDNYTHTLRADVFDPYVSEWIETWDQAHAAEPIAELRIPDDVLESMRARFYSSLGERFGCDAARHWLDQSRALPFPVHPRAFT